jgi:hypothetical protein
MKLLFCCLLAGALPALGQRDLPVAPIDQPVAPITVYTEFQRDPPPSVFVALRNEVQSIMSPLGVQFTWRPLAGSHENEVSVELAVVSFQGRCDSDALSSHAAPPGKALGWTHISDGLILPFSDVDCDSIRGFIQRELLRKKPAARDLLFGRAVGRVMAHELYHIFANTTHHGKLGVAKRAYTAKDLLSPTFHFEEQASDALRTSKVHASALLDSHGN